MTVKHLNQTIRKCLASGLSAMAMMVVLSAVVKAQSMPLSNYRAMNPQYFNPASYGLKTWHRFDFLHAQRGLPDEGFETTTEYFNYISPAFGKATGEDSLGIFGWGVSSYYEKDFTDTRFLLRPSMAVRIITSKNLEVSLGGSVGLVFLGQNFSDVQVTTLGDPGLTERTNVNYLDVGLSGDVRYTQPGSFVLDAQVMAGEMKKTSLPFLNNEPWESYEPALPPSLLLSGGAQFEINSNLLLGPRFFYQRIVFDPHRGNQIPTLDLGARANFKSPEMWFSGSYLINGDAFRGGMGIQFKQPVYDTIAGRNRSIPAWAFNLGFTIPQGENANLGPSAELGIALLLPTKMPVINYTKVFDFSAAFWKSDADLLKHLKTFSTEDSMPPKLAARTFIKSFPDTAATDTNLFKKGSLDAVSLIYEFPDNSERFAGDAPVFSQDHQIKSLGSEWEGIDYMVDYLFNRVVEMATHPDSTIIEKISNDFDSLEYLGWIEIKTKLKAEHEGAKFGYEADLQGQQGKYVVPYDGNLIDEFGHRNDTIRVLARFDGVDSLFKIAPGDPLTDLSLAALKQYALRMRILQEIKEYYGDTLGIGWEEKFRHTDIYDNRSAQKHMLYIRKLDISAGHVHQDGRMRHEIILKFNPHLNQKLPGQNASKSEEPKSQSKERKKPPSATNKSKSKEKSTKSEKPARRVKSKPDKPAKTAKKSKKKKNSSKDLRKLLRK